MIKLIKFEEEGFEPCMFPNGKLVTPEVILSKFPSATIFPHVIELNGDICQSVTNLNMLRESYNIASDLTETEAIVALETILNTPAPPPPPTAEERMASAMEFQNLLAMEDLS